MKYLYSYLTRHLISRAIQFALFYTLRIGIWILHEVRNWALRRLRQSSGRLRRSFTIVAVRDATVERIVALNSRNEETWLTLVRRLVFCTRKRVFSSKISALVQMEYMLILFSCANVTQRRVACSLLGECQQSWFLRILGSWFTNIHNRDDGQQLLGAQTRHVDLERKCDVKKNTHIWMQNRLYLLAHYGPWEHLCSSWST